MRGKRKVTKEDREWSSYVKLRDEICLVCGSEVNLNAHHLIPREIKEFRYDIENGITLCPKHHRFSFELSAHQNPFAFMLWFRNTYPEWFNKIIKKINSLD